MITIQTFDGPNLIKEWDFTDYDKAKEYTRSLKKQGYTFDYNNKKGLTYAVWDDAWDERFPVYHESYDGSIEKYRNCLQ